MLFVCFLNEYLQRISFPIIFHKIYKQNKGANNVNETFISQKKKKKKKNTFQGPLRDF